MSARTTSSNIGSGAVYETFAIDDSTITYDATEENGSAQVGLAVTFSTHDTVELVEDGDPIVGKLIQVEKDGFCTVQTGGVMTLPGGDSATLTVGLAIVGDLGAASAKGYIRIAASGTAAELVKCRGQICNSATTTAVVVRL